MSFENETVDVGAAFAAVSGEGYTPWTPVLDAPAVDQEPDVADTTDYGYEGASNETAGARAQKERNDFNRDMRGDEDDMRMSRRGQLNTTSAVERRRQQQADSRSALERMLEAHAEQLEFIAQRATQYQRYYERNPQKAQQDIHENERKMRETRERMEKLPANDPQRQAYQQQLNEWQAQNIGAYNALSQLNMPVKPLNEQLYDPAVIAAYKDKVKFEAMDAGSQRLVAQAEKDLREGRVLTEAGGNPKAENRRTGLENVDIPVSDMLEPDQGGLSKTASVNASMPSLQISDRSSLIGTSMESAPNLRGSFNTASVDITPVNENKANVEYRPGQDKLPNVHFALS